MCIAYIYRSYGLSTYNECYCNELNVTFSTVFFQLFFIAPYIHTCSDVCMWRNVRIVKTIEQKSGKHLRMSSYDFSIQCTHTYTYIPSFDKYGELLMSAFQ